MDNPSKCQLCNEKEAKYVCPRCNMPYCSLECYQSQLHSQCSESFYKDCVVEQIKSDNIDPQSQLKMIEILQRVQHIDEQFKIDEVQDSDDEDSEEDLATRMAGVDLDDADSVWNKLTLEEKHQFEELLRSGDVSNVVPPWQPWWLYKEEKLLVEDLGASTKSYQLPPNMPELIENIQPLSKLSKVSPSHCVRWNVVNVLAAYSITARTFNGDCVDSSQEAASTLVSLSDTLSNNQNFDEPESAVAAVHLAAVNNSNILIQIDEELLKEDVQRIVEGPSKLQQNLYVLAALSDVHHLLFLSKKKAKENSTSKGSGEFHKRFPELKSSVQKILTVPETNKFLKKLEFYLSWAVEFY